MIYSRRNYFLLQQSLYGNHCFNLDHSLKPILEQDPQTSILSIFTYPLKVREFKPVSVNIKKPPNEKLELSYRQSIPKFTLKKRAQSAKKPNYQSKLKLLTLEQLIEAKRYDRCKSFISQKNVDKTIDRSEIKITKSPEQNQSFGSPQSMQELKRSIYQKEKEEFLKQLYLPYRQKKKPKKAKKKKKSLKKEQEKNQNDSTLLYGLWRPSPEENQTNYQHEYYFQKYINQDNASFLSRTSRSSERKIKIPIFDLNFNSTPIKFDQ